MWIDFSGKIIVPFCTSGSSGIGSSATNLEPLTSGAAWLPGRRFSGRASQSTIMEWVSGLGLDVKIVSQNLGHASTSVTMEIYTHLTEDKKREQEAVAQTVKIS